MTDNDPRREPPRDPERSRMEEELRRSLARHAAQSPTDDIAGLVAERILHAADRQGVSQPRGRTRRISWAAPAAAAAVLVVLAGVVLSIVHFGSGSSDRAADGYVSGARTVVPTTSAPPPTTSVSHSPTPPTSSRVAPPPPAHPTLTGVRIQDLTFDTTDDGWAIGSADCAAGTCLAVFHTTDGSTWQSEGGNFGFNVPGISTGCTDKCVEHIRFATDKVGYAYGPSAFFMTTDGGKNWKQQAGGAQAVESTNDNVIRVLGTDGGCPGPCDITVQTSAIGSTTWTTRTLGRQPNDAATAVSLARSDSDAYVLVTGHVAGGAQSATSTMYRSTDNGLTWTPDGEPCQQNGGSSGEVDSVMLAAAPDGVVAALCRARQAPNRAVVDLSTDQGSSFRAATGTVPQQAGLLAGDPSTVLLTGGDGIARSTDRGNSWDLSSQVKGTVSFVGFESPTVGRAVTGGNTIWTTRNGGVSWTAYRFD